MQHRKEAKEQQKTRRAPRTRAMNSVDQKRGQRFSAERGWEEGEREMEGIR